MRRNMDSRDGLRNDQPVGGSRSRSNREQVEHQHPLSVNMEEDLHARDSCSENQAPILEENFTGSQGFRRTTVSGQANTYVQARSMLDTGLCSPLKLSDVVVESYFRFKSGEVVNGNSGGFMVDGKGVEITKKKGKWKRWAREGGVREVGSMGEYVEGRKRPNGVELEAGVGSGKK
ncbi:hypothetical protein Q3G72_020121 [Acer saccharum]|nr:hypothetical protein Q3G72_020121 [Acer saccharum]